MNAPMRPYRRWPRRRLVAAAIAVGAFVLPATPASADAARPGDVWSSVVRVVPGDAPVSAEVVGGDAFIRVTLEPGHEATVFDYQTPPQPYLRYLRDGTVQENVHSKAHYQNRSRYAAEPGTEVLGEPSWSTVASGGVYAWHDHRVHFMARSRASVTQWQLDLAVDGHPVAVAGFWGPAGRPSPLPWFVLGVGLGAWALVATILNVRVGAAISVAAALFALPIAISLGRLPAAGGLVRTGGLVVAALVLAIAALAVRARPVAAALLGGSGIALVVWSVRRLDVLGHGVLITSMPPWWDRASVAAALGIGMAVVAVTVHSLVAADDGPLRVAAPFADATVRAE